MRVENIGPDDIQVGDILTAENGRRMTVTHVVEPTIVIAGTFDGSRNVFEWMDQRWRLGASPSAIPYTAHRDVPDEWERRQGNFVAPRDGDWAFVVDYHIGLEGTRNQGWVEGVVAQTAQWLTDRLNEGHFGEMPSRKAV